MSGRSNDFVKFFAIVQSPKPRNPPLVVCCTQWGLVVLVLELELLGSGVAGRDLYNWVDPGWHHSSFEAKAKYAQKNKIYL